MGGAAPPPAPCRAAGSIPICRAIRSPGFTSRIPTIAARRFTIGKYLSPKLFVSYGYGLSASLWSRDVNRCHRVANALRTGIVWVNCWFARDLRTPFGGMKASGIGREGGRYSLEFFSEAKTVAYRFYS